VNALGPVSQSSSFSSKIPFPTIVSFGYGIELPHDVRLEADGEWLQFSRFQQLPLDAPTAISFGPGVSIPFNLPAAVQNWRDTFTAGAGASWHFSEHWTLRGGYEYFQTPAPDATFNPIIPDADQHAVTIGLGMRSGHHRLNLSYGHVFYLDRTINASNQPGTPYAGKFEVDVHLMSVAYGYSF
jgi:long-chain fatty acid transport protein